MRFASAEPSVGEPSETTQKTPPEIDTVTTCRFGINPSLETNRIPKSDKRHKLDERNHVELPLLEQLDGRFSL